jgi:hypothetical protein
MIWDDEITPERENWTWLQWSEHYQKQIAAMTDLPSDTEPEEPQPGTCCHNVTDCILCMTGTFAGMNAPPSIGPWFTTPPTYPATIYPTPDPSTPREMPRLESKSERMYRIHKELMR